MNARFLILVVFVIALAGATVALAVAVAGAGMGPLFGAIGPALLLAALALRWHRTRR